MVGSGPSELPFAAVEAKIQRPVHRDGLVARTKLLDDLASTPDRVSLMLLTGPAGYGKTTVLSQWAAEDSREFAWVTVDEADKDPVRLAGHVALALHRIQPLDRGCSGLSRSATGQGIWPHCPTCWCPCGPGAGPACWCSTTSTSWAALRR